MLPVALLLLVAAVSADIDVKVSVDWDSEIIRTRTAATVEVDVMPFLGRTQEGGSFNAYYEALANLGSEFVRYAPWYPNPRVVVPELTPVDCTKDKPATNWNSTLFDGIMRDFMHAVCGPNAESGECKLSVVQQLSTMPSWMYKGGYCQDASPSCLPLDPWDTTDPFNAYAAGKELVDTSCGSMARYMGRLVGWYTAGGFTDECGHFHESGLHYDWYGVSILNEDEHGIQPDNGQAYVQCYDAMEKEIRKQGNEDIVLVGPEIAGTSGHATEYLLYHLNASNHDPPVPPQVSSYHWGSSADNSSAEGFLSSWEKTYNDPDGSIQMAEKLKKETGQETELVLNEYIPFVGDWCDLSTIPAGMDKSKCPNWQDNRTAGGDPNLQHGKGVQINRKTWSWNAAAAVFAYGYGSLAMLGYKYVGQDQLIGGTWPDNEPAVSCMDWTTGQVNAKYWVINMLAMTVGTKDEKTIVASNVTVSGGPPPPAPPKIGQIGSGTCGVTAFSDDCSSESDGCFNTTTYGIKTLAECVAKVKTCGKNGNFASFSLQNNDCSWYASCDMDALDKVGAGYKSESVTGKGASSGHSGDSDPLFVMPYVMEDRKGLLLVNKKAQHMSVTIGGATGGNALVVEVATEGPDKEEPAFAPQIAKKISKEGVLQLGPFGVAVVTELEEGGRQ